MAILNKFIKYKNLKISFKDSRDLLKTLKNMSLLQSITHLKQMSEFKDNPTSKYSKCSEIIYERLYNLFKKLTAETSLAHESFYIDKIYVTKGKLLQISVFRRARGSSSPKYKKSCNLYVLLKNNE